MISMDAAIEAVRAVLAEQLDERLSDEEKLALMPGTHTFEVTIDAGGTPRVMRPKLTFASTLIQGNSPLSWNTMALTTAQPGASTRIAPLDWASSPARIRSKVDFPQPEGPTMQTNSPGDTLRLMSSSARMQP